MRKCLLPGLIFLFLTSSSAQGDLQMMLEAERSFMRRAADQGIKPAFLEFLTRDSVVFYPDAVNGHEYWSSNDDLAARQLVRKATYADIAANGLLGYTTGNWRLYHKGKGEEMADFGQYVTIWRKEPPGKFRAVFDIRIGHEKPPLADSDQTAIADRGRDMNKRGWSPADASMNFTKLSMGEAGLAGAYKMYAGSDVRLLIDREPPILGKKKVVSAMRSYSSIEFPAKIALFQSADMAYTWNPCSYSNSKEGTERGNCLHIWKLRDEKWLIVLGVFARVVSGKPPELILK